LSYSGLLAAPSSNIETAILLKARETANT